MIRLTLDDCFDTMPWDGIDTVVFDVGNVLLSFDPPHILEEALPHQPELYPELMRKMFRSAYWPMLDRGTLTPEEAVEVMTGKDTALHEAIHTVMYSWVEMKHVVTEGVDAVKACKAHGKRLYVLSNYEKAFFDIVDARYDFFRLFDGKLISSHEGLTKPDPAIFRLLAARYDIDPARALFIDDSPLNVESALSEGWQAILFNQPGQLAKFIR